MSETTEQGRKQRPNTDTNTDTITVKILRNISPGPEMGIPKSEFDELGRIRKGKIVALPSEYAKELIKSKIASSDAALSES